MKEVKIGFLGCGNVGGGVWNLLENFRKEIRPTGQIVYTLEETVRYIYEFNEI